MKYLQTDESDVCGFCVVWWGFFAVSFCFCLNNKTEIWLDLLAGFGND